MFNVGPELLQVSITASVSVATMVPPEYGGNSASIGSTLNTTLRLPPVLICPLFGTVMAYPGQLQDCLNELRPVWIRQFAGGGVQVIMMSQNRDRCTASDAPCMISTLAVAPL